MASSTISHSQARREAVVDAHIRAEATDHDVPATLATFRHPRYEVPALNTIADGPGAVTGVVDAVLTAFPDSTYARRQFVTPKMRLLSSASSAALTVAYGLGSRRLERRCKFRAF
jgi:hypothetical protein